MGKPVVEPVAPQPVVDPAIQRQLAKLEEEKRIKLKTQAEDKAKEDARKAKELATNQAIEKAQQEQRAKILASPLSEEDLADYQNLLRIANSGREQLTSMGATRLSDYRTRLKNNGVPNPA